MARTARQRRFILLLGAAALATLAAAAISLWSLAPRVVTWAAMRDARRHWKEIVPSLPPSSSRLFEFRLFRPKDPLDGAMERATRSLFQRYGSLFGAGYLDRAYLVDEVPLQGCTPEALPVLLVILTHLQVCQEKFKGETLLAGPPYNRAMIGEVLDAVRPVLKSARAKEALVNLLIEDYEALPGKKEPAGLVKMGLYSVLTARAVDEYGPGTDIQPEAQSLMGEVLAAIGSEEWSPVLAHTSHPREKVRAGSLLLLCQHAAREVFRQRALKALEDPQELVRIAAAGTLAYHGDGAGESHLRGGLGHGRWEVRWWCGKSLAYVRGEGARQAILQQALREPDAWVRSEMQKRLRAFR